jgi:hypothetical protein
MWSGVFWFVLSRVGFVRGDCSKGQQWRCWWFCVRRLQQGATAAVLVVEVLDVDAAAGQTCGGDVEQRLQQGATAANSGGGGNYVRR